MSDACLPLPKPGGSVYVSHRLEEILEIADRITVLRDGKRIDTVDVDEVDESTLAEMMVGREVDDVLAREVDDVLAEEVSHTAKRDVALTAIGIARPPRLKR